MAMTTTPIKLWLTALAILNGLLAWGAVALKSWLWEFFEAAFGDAIPAFTERSYFAPHVFAAVALVAVLTAIVTQMGRISGLVALNTMCGLFCVDIVVLAHVVAGIAGPFFLLAETFTHTG